MDEPCFKSSTHSLIYTLTHTYRFVNRVARDNAGTLMKKRERLISCVEHGWLHYFIAVRSHMRFVKHCTLLLQVVYSGFFKRATVWLVASATKLNAGLWTCVKVKNIYRSWLIMVIIMMIFRFDDDDRRWDLAITYRVSLWLAAANFVQKLVNGWHTFVQKWIIFNRLATFSAKWEEYLLVVVVAAMGVI